MSCLLDTNVCVNYLRSPGQSNITRNLLSCQPDDVFLCSVVKGELIYGAYRSRNVQQNLREVQLFYARFFSLPFDDAAAEIYGQVRSNLADQGQLIGPNDLMIASIALAHDLTLVTHNLGEFGRIPGLNLDDWEV